MKLNIYKLIFFHLTWFFVFSNFLIAWFSPISLVVQTLRDSWIIYPFILAIRRKNFSLLILLYTLFLGLFLLSMNFSLINLKLFLYSTRDYILIILVAQLLIVDFKFNNKYVLNFIHFIILFSFGSLIIQIFRPELTDFIFKKNEYFSNKGVSSNLGFGLFGERALHPFYSPNLLGEFIFFTYFTIKYSKKKQIKYKFIAFIVGVFTLSKSIFVNFLFRFFRKKPLLPLMLIVLISVLFPLMLGYLYSHNIDFFLINHLYSIIGHLNAFSSIDKYFEIYPTFFGEASVLNNVLNGIVQPGVESTLLSRLYEIKFIFSIPILGYIIYTIYCLKRNKKILFLCFIALLTLTATANHPVIIIPLIYIINEKSDTYI